MWSYVKNSFWLNLALFFLMIFFLYGAGKIVYQAAVLYKERGDTRRKIGELTQKREALERRIGELATPEAVEREAKKRLNLKKIGENVVVILPEKKDKPPQSSLENFWEKVKAWLKF